MTGKANPTLIGAFVLAGVALAITTVLLVSSASLFTRKATYILYFNDSLTGLDPGTAVKFRGVTIGSVKEVLVHFNQHPHDSSLPVIIELNGNLLTERTDNGFDLINDEQFENALKRGLRGKLEAQSLLTGLLYVQLDFLPKTPEVRHQIKPIYKEIPTANTEMQIFRVDFAEVVSNLNATLSRIEKSLSELQVREISVSLTNLLHSAHAVISSSELTNTVLNARLTLEQFRSLSETLQRNADRLTCSAEGALAESRSTLLEVRGGVQDVREVLAPDGALRRDLSDALEQLSEAARSVNALADFLSRHPNALLSGRKSSEAKR